MAGSAGSKNDVSSNKTKSYLWGSTHGAIEKQLWILKKEKREEESIRFIILDLLSEVLSGKITYCAHLFQLVHTPHMRRMPKRI